MAIAPAKTRPARVLRADGADPDLRDRGRAPVQGGPDRRLLPPLLGAGGDDVGVVDAMQDDDLLVTGYRSHGFALARGTSPEAVMAELFGREDGCAHGRGGSMHLLDVERGYYGGWGIVAGQLPVATGLALALVRQGKPQAVVCELGDGAVNMGAWHESLNLAALWRLPIVFLVVNNEYGMGTAVDRASAEPELHKRASAYRMHGERVDGDDLDAVVEASDRLLRARARGPRAGRARGDDLPLPRPLRRRRRPRLPHQGRDRRAPGARPARCASRAQLREAGVTDRGAATRSTRAPTSASSRPSSSRPQSPEPDVGALAAGMHAPGHATSSSRACGRAARSASRSSCSTRGWARERRDRAAAGRRPGGRHRAHDLPRGAAPRAARGDGARRARLHHGRGGRRLRGLLQGHRRADGRVRRRPRARHADLRGGLRRRRRRRGDARRAPGRGDHDDELPARRDGPGHQPRREDRRDVRRRGALPAGDPHAERRRQPADGAALAVASTAGSRARPASRSSRRRTRPTRRAC